MRACKPSLFPKCDIKNPDQNNPNCDNATADPVKGRILKADVSGSDVIITVGVGSDQGVGKSGWSGKVLQPVSPPPDRRPASTSLAAIFCLTVCLYSLVSPSDCG